MKTERSNRMGTKMVESNTKICATAMTSIKRSNKFDRIKRKVAEFHCSKRVASRIFFGLLW